MQTIEIEIFFKIDTVF